MWVECSEDRMAYLKLLFKMSFFAVYFKTSSFKNYINNHLGFSFLISGLFLIKDTQASISILLNGVSVFFWEERWGIWGQKKSKQEGREKSKDIQYIHFPWKMLCLWSTPTYKSLNGNSKGWRRPTMEHLSPEGKYSNTPRMLYWAPQQKPCYTECIAKKQTFLQFKLLQVICYSGL